MNANSKLNRPVCFALLAVMLSSAGCTQSIPWKSPKIFSLDSTWPFRDKGAPHEGTPVRIVSTWTDTVLTQPGQQPQRGFGGRLMFYEKDGKKPILVDGQLVVYAFDEVGRDPTNNKPTRRYVFPPDQIPLHMSKSELGASYSFWLPWDDVGGPQTEVSLICRFEPKVGGVVTSDQTRQVLPGRNPTTVAKTGTHQPPKVPEGVPTRPGRQTLESLQDSRTVERNARLISYETSTPPANQQTAAMSGAPQVVAMPEKRMTTTTISLPPNYELPNAAVANAPAQSASYPPSTSQVPQQISPYAAQSQVPAAGVRTYVPTMPTASIQPMGVNQTYVGGLPQQQIPPQTQVTTFGGTQPTMPVQSFQPPVMQQSMPQPPPIQQPWPQLPQQMQRAPAQAGPTTTITYPAPGLVPG